MVLVPRDVSCVILPGRFTDGRIVPGIYNEIYGNWKGTWAKAFTEAGSPQSLSAESFLRANAVVALHQGNSVIGLLLTSIYNLSSDPTFDHHYFDPFPGPLMASLRSSVGGLVLTGEYHSVSPEYRKAVTGVPYSAVIVGLLMKMFLELKGKMLFTTTIATTRVDETSKKYGCAEVGVCEKCNIKCLSLYVTPSTYRDHDDPVVVSLIDRFWKSRTDYTGLTAPLIMDGGMAKAA